MPTRQSDALRNAKAAAVRDLLDAGSGPGYVEIYTGSQPATPATAASGTLLATVTLEDPSFGSPSAGVMTLADPDSVNAVATGTAGWCRFYNSDDAVVFDGNVTATGGGGTVTVNTTAFVNGEPVDFTGGTWTEPM